ncbi:MAG: hypothetical protein M3534_10860 [Actinomycetota bacterium]|nr:hypothetical protein [Actinomycetota bacterium]
MRRDVEPNGPALRPPPGYSQKAGGPGRLVLRRADGSTVAVFAFSAFGPTPEAIREAAEEDRPRPPPGDTDGQEGADK